MMPRSKLWNNFPKTIIGALIATLVFLSSWGCFKTITGGSFKNFESNYSVFVPEKANDVNKSVRNGSKTITINYTYEEKYPAQKLVAFYDSLMANNHYDEYHNEYLSLGNAKWESMIDGTQTGQPLVFQYSKMWMDKKSSYVIHVFLRYYDYSARNDKLFSCESEKVTPTNDKLHVIIQLMPLDSLPNKPIP
jgi:hypothetical protein